MRQVSYQIQSFVEQGGEHFVRERRHRQVKMAYQLILVVVLVSAFMTVV